MKTGSLFLSLNFQEEIPSRIMLVPSDRIVKGRDSREWKNNNPKQAALNSNVRLPMLPIDENHSTDLSAPKGGASPAFGWMKNLCADESGAIWADVEWTERGREAVSKKEYRFISPVFAHNEKGEINCILRAALTNTPNLELPALNSEQLEINKKEVPMSKELLALLGLTETATEADVIAAVKTLNAAKETTALQAEKPKVDLAAYAPRADLNAMETRAVAAEKQLADLNAERIKKDAEAVVDEGIAKCKIAPASKAEYLALCSTKEGLETVRKIVADGPAIISAAPAAPAGAAPGTQVSLNSEEAAFAKAAGKTPEEWAKLREAGK
ncbi:MAG: phage protease [Treponema sp.]|nr:phage protease [Treponema sp.]